MSSQALDDSETSVFTAPASKRTFVPSSSPLSLFGGKRVKFDSEFTGTQIVHGDGSPVKGRGVGKLPTENLCIFAGVDHSEDDCTGICFEESGRYLLIDDDEYEGSQEVRSYTPTGKDTAANDSGSTVKSTAVAGDGNEDSPNAKRDVIYISSDPPDVDNDPSSVWSMHTATSEMMGTGTGTVANIAPDIKDVFFHRGEDRRIGENDYPTVIYINRVNGKVYQSVVNRELFFIKRDLTGFDKRALWLQTDVYIGVLMDKCVQDTSNALEAFPILNRHGNHILITDDGTAEAADAPTDLRSAVRRGWERLIALYGDFNDNQHEQRALVDKAFWLLGHYQRAIASRDLTEMLKINALFDPLRDALNELALNEYVIRELFFGDMNPQFVDAISMMPLD